MRTFFKYILFSIALITFFSLMNWRYVAFALSFITAIICAMFLVGHIYEIILNKLAMRIVIYKNHRRPFLFNYLFPFVIFRKYWFFTRTFMFTEDTLYKFGNEHDLDVNKLFGLSGGFNHFKNSVRFGWNINENMQKINIFAYIHNDGKFKFNKIAELLINQWFTFEFSFMDETAILRIYDINRNLINTPPFLIKFKRGFIEYKLGIYFGGNMRAPKNITFYKSTK